MYRLGVFLPVKGDYYTEAVIEYLKDQERFEIFLFHQRSRSENNM